MKHILAILSVVFSVTAVIAQTTGAAITAEVKAGKFTINKADVTNDWRQDIVSVALNGKDRRRAGFNTTHSYDNFGIVLFEKNDDNKLPSGTLSEIQFYFQNLDTTTVSPKGVFTGKLKIENLAITTSLTPGVLKSKLKNYKDTDSYMPHNYRLAYMGIYIYFRFNDEETALLKVSVGKDNRTY